MGYAKGWWEQPVLCWTVKPWHPYNHNECAAALQVNWANTRSLLATEGEKKTDVGYFIETFYKEQEQYVEAVKSVHVGQA